MVKNIFFPKVLKVRLDLKILFLAVVILAVCLTGIALPLLGVQIASAASSSMQKEDIGARQNSHLKKHLLVITSQPYLTEWFNTLNHSLRQSLFSFLSSDSKISYEFIGSESLTDDDYDLKLIAMLKEKYARIKLDMVVAVMPVSCQFLLDHGKSTFPGIATVFVLPTKTQALSIAEKSNTGIVKSAADAISDTIERIRILLPDTRQLLVVSGSGMDDLNYQLMAKDVLIDRGWPETTVYLKGLSAEELAARLEKLPGHSAVLMLTYLEDAQGKPLTTVQVLKAVSERTAAPIFSFYDTVIGMGIVGGKLTSAEAYGEAIADTAIKMFKSRSKPLQIETVAQARDIYDWRQIEKWKIPQDRLPANSIIRYRKVTFWEENGTMIALIAAVILLETVLIVALLFNLARRKRAEEALNVSVKKYHDIFNNSVMGIFQSTPQGKFLSVNPAFAGLFGYASPEALLADIQDIQNDVYVDPEDWTRFKKLFAEEDSVRGFKARLKRRDGSLLWISTAGKAIRNPEGIILYYEGTIEDVTQQKQAEAELKKYREHLERLVDIRTAELAAAMEKLKVSEERYGFALEASNDGLWDWNISENISYCNPAYFKMLGYEPGELGPDTQSHWIDLMHPEDRERALEITQKLLKSDDTYEIEFRMRAKDGRYKWILSRGKVVTRDEKGRPARAVGTHTDLTAHKQMEIELRKAGEEMHAIVEMATTGITLIRNRVMIRCNRKMEEIFGYGPGELVGKTTRLWYESEDVFAEIGHEVAKQVGKTGVFFQERQLVRKDGTLFWARMSARGISSRGAPLELVGIIEDITTERETMEILRQAKERAESADRLKSAFLATMSHELRTPLNSIIGFTGILLQRMGGPLNEEQDKQLHMVFNSAKHLLDLINDILDLSKIEAQQLNVVCEEFCLRDSVEKVVKSSQPLADKKGIELSVFLAPEIVDIKSDRRRVEQILLNLLSNAIKFTEHGFVRLDGQRQGNKVVLAVSDSGIGIKEEDRGLLFSAFRQIECGITRKYEGTGLGLSICKKLAHMLQGEIEVESVWEQGSTFRLILPLEGENV